LRVGATVAAWLVAVVIVLRLLDAIDFGTPGLPVTVTIHFVVKTALLTALAWGAARSLPLRRKPGLRGTVALALWIGLVVLSDCLSRLDAGVLEAMLAQLRSAMGVGGFVIGIIVYALALALPFVPGVEVGLMVMMLFGDAGATAVYVATIAGLALAFAAGRLIPAHVFARLLAQLGVTMPDATLDMAMRRIMAGGAEGRGGWSRFAAVLVKYRYLAVAAAVNLPGNSALGGGGGIALLCGASRTFRWHWFVLTMMVATAPVPLLVVVGGLDVRDLVVLHDVVQNAFARLFEGL
jgi:hypothetical protein